MAKTATLTIRMTPKTKAQLDLIAKSTRRTRSFLASQALAHYAESEAEIVAGIEQAIAEMEAGEEGIPHEEAMRQIRETIRQVAQIKVLNAENAA